MISSPQLTVIASLLQAFRNALSPDGPDFHRTGKHLRDVQTLPARSPLPDVIVNLVSQRLGVILRERWSRQRFPQGVEDGNMHLGLCGRVLRPVVHPRQQYQELSSRLFGCFLYPCANVLISVIINPIIC